MLIVCSTSEKKKKYYTYPNSRANLDFEISFISDKVYLKVFTSICNNG